MGILLQVYITEPTFPNYQMLVVAALAHNTLLGLYDLQKAFDSVEYPVMLRRLFEVGVNGKAWRLLKNWYEGAKCQVRLGGALSETFKI